MHPTAFLVIARRTEVNEAIQNLGSEEIGLPRSQGWGIRKVALPGLRPSSVLGEMLRAGQITLSFATQADRRAILSHILNFRRLLILFKACP